MGRDDSEESEDLVMFFAVSPGRDGFEISMRNKATPKSARASA